MKKFIVFTALILCGTTMSFGQAQKAKSNAAGKWEVYGGYAFARTYGLRYSAGAVFNF